MQLEEAWRGALQGDDAEIWRSVDQFLANYEGVEEGELDPEVGFPGDYRDGNQDEEAGEDAPLLEAVPTELDRIKAVAKQVTRECIDRFKTAEGRKEIAGNIGPGGLAGYIEGEILEQVKPYLKKSVKSLVPWGRGRKNRHTLAGFTEGAVDVIYNACGFGVEAMSAAAATPAVAAGGATYKGAFAASGVRRAGGSKDQAAAIAAVTGMAEFGQGMIPFAGGGFGIASGLKGAADKTRILTRIDNMVKGAGGGSSAMAARPETMGDKRVFQVLEARGDHLADLIVRASACADANLKTNKKKLKKLAQAQTWLNRQARKSRKRFAKSDAKGNVPLLSRVDETSENDGESDLE